MVLTLLIATYAGRVTSQPPLRSLRSAFKVGNALLPIHLAMEFAASVTSLSPVKLSVPDLLTSELLRFL